jgi:hypothetical protein
MKCRSRARNVVLLGLSLVLFTARAEAQQIIGKGEFGMMGGTMAPPGLYVGAFGLFSWQDELRDRNGNELPVDLELNQQAFGPLIMWVTDLCILGGNYSATFAAPFANVLIDFPRLDVSGSTGIALSQLWIIPVSIGWHFPQADLTFHYAFYPPTGRYTPGASNNTGLGMWVNELSLRGTVFFDKAKDWHFALSAFYDINGKKEDLDWKTGDPVTLMYGMGRNYGSGMLKGWAGVAGYAQWQVTDTTGADAPLLARLNKTTIYGVGPELTTMQGALTIRYFWQFGGKFSTQGQGLYVPFVMPLKF